MPRPRIKPAANIEDPIGELTKGIDCVINQQQSDLSIAHLHRAVSQQVGSGKSEQEKVFKLLIAKVEVQFDNWHKELCGNAGDPLLVLFNRKYLELTNYCQIFPKFYMPYDKKVQNKDEKILNAIRNSFQKIILSDTNLIQRATIESLLKNIGYAENSGSVDMPQLTNLIQMLYSFRPIDQANGCDNFKVFWDKLLEQTDTFYNNFFNQKHKSMSFIDYLKTARQQFELEQSLMSKILNERDTKEILATAFNQMFISREEIFLAGENPQVADGMKEDAISMQWVIKSYINLEVSIERIYTTLAEYIRSQMLTIKIEKSVFSGISNLIETTQKLKNQFNDVFKLSEFKDAHATLIANIKEAWNDDQFNITVNFNEYIDHLIQNKFKGMNKQEKYDIIGIFYEYVRDKQSFKVNYTSRFVRRLIKLTKDLPDLEFPVIASIRKKNSDFLSDYDDFIRQMNHSLKSIEQFREAQKNQEIKFEPFIFHQRNFPLSTIEEAFVPQEYQLLNNDFIDFYRKTNPETDLKLLRPCSTIEIQIRSKAQQRALIHTLITDFPCGYLILSLSKIRIENQSPRLTFKRIVELFNNDRDIAKKVCFRLIQTVPVLSRISSKDPKVFDDNDIIFLNPKFKHNTTTIVIPPAKSEKKEQQKVNDAYIQSERRDAIQATIIRTLKANGEMDSTKVEIAVIQALQEYFQADVNQIRTEIDQCMKSNYLRKIQNGDNVILKYIA